jgi:hypothetical protein
MPGSVFLPGIESQEILRQIRVRGSGQQIILRGSGQQIILRGSVGGIGSRYLPWAFLFEVPFDRQNLPPQTHYQIGHPIDGEQSPNVRNMP